LDYPLRAYHFATFLRSVKFIGQTALRAYLDVERIGLHATTLDS
jgi:hypothetical protein